MLLSINSLSIIDNKLYGLTSDSKLVIISDLHKTTANYSVTPINLPNNYDQIFKLKNHDNNSFKIGLLKKSTDGTDGKMTYCDYDGSNITEPSNTEYNNVLNLTTNAENDRIYVLNQSTHTFKLEYYGNYSFGTVNTRETLSGDTASRLQQEKMV